MKHLFKLILAIIWMAAAARATTLSGTLKMPDGTLANGYLYFSLSQQGIQLTTGSCGGPAVLSPIYQVPFKVTSGAITTLLGGSPVVVGNDCITPANTYYYVTFRDLQGNILFKETWPITGTTLDVGTITPIRIAQGTSDLGATFIPTTAGSGTELQYRVSQTSLGAVVGSSVDPSGNVTLLSLIQAADASRLDSGGLKIASNKVLGFSSTTASSGSVDVGLSRDQTGIVDIGNGTAGDKTGQAYAAGFWAWTGSTAKLGSDAATGYRLGSDRVVGWNSGTAANGTLDTGLSRDSAGVIDFGNGTAANASGTAKMAALILNTTTLNSVSGNTSKVQLESGTATSGNLVKFDANGNTVDATFNAAAFTKKVIVFRIGSDGSGTVLVDTDDEANFFVNRFNSTVLISQVKCWSDTGTPIINLQRDDGSPANILSSDLTCSTSGAVTTTFSGSEASVATDNKLDFKMVTAGGAAHRVTVVIEGSLQ
jgi:hypothetical protein